MLVDSKLIQCSLVLLQRPNLHGFRSHLAQQDLNHKLRTVRQLTWNTETEMSNTASSETTRYNKLISS